LDLEEDEVRESIILYELDRTSPKGRKYPKNTQFHLVDHNEANMKSLPVNLSFQKV